MTAYRRNVLFSKLGRAWQLDRNDVSSIGGDQDVQVLLMKLARRNPDVQFILIGKNTGQNPQVMGYPENVVNPWEQWRKSFGNIRLKEITKTNVEDYMRRFLDIAGPYLRDADDWIDCLGQHGAANSFIPQIMADIDGEKVPGAWDNPRTYANPQMSFVNYCSYLAHAMNWWTRAINTRGPQFLCFDPRNTIKCREIGWPPRRPVLAQADATYGGKFERYDDLLNPPDYGYAGDWHREGTVWAGTVEYKYGAIELCSMPEPAAIPWSEFPRKGNFGIISNETRCAVSIPRGHVLHDWILPFHPNVELYGKWTDNTLRWLGVDIQPIPYTEMYSKMRTFRSTFTMPASGSTWATIKGWEAFAVGTPCFFHWKYDGQGHIIPTRDQIEHDLVNDPNLRFLGDFLRVHDAEDLAAKVKMLQDDDALWSHVVRLQRRRFEDAYAATAGGVLAIEHAVLLK